MALASALALGAPGAGAETTGDNGDACKLQTVPVSVGRGDTDQNLNVVTELCGPSPLAGRVVHVLVSGATYGPLAWAFPYQPERYSYVRALNQAGIATLNVDRLGIGRSSHPDSSEVTTPAHIAIYHQLIQGLRHGAYGTVFDKVVVVGHSYGSVIAYGLANRYPADVDGVIITGLQHEFDPTFLREFWGNLHPANEEGGRFTGLDGGYLTSQPGHRAAYYRQATVDPKVVELDEQTKETFTTADARTFPPIMGESRGITDPVLDVIGEYDSWFCANEPCSSPSGTPSRERRWFPATPCFEQFVLPGAGHDINLHFDAGKWFAVAAEWTQRMVAGRGPCQAK